LVTRLRISDRSFGPGAFIVSTPMFRRFGKFLQASENSGLNHDLHATTSTQCRLADLSFVDRSMHGLHSHSYGSIGPCRSGRGPFRAFDQAGSSTASFSLRDYFRSEGPGSASGRRFCPGFGERRAGRRRVQMASCGRPGLLYDPAAASGGAGYGEPFVPRRGPRSGGQRHAD